MTSSAYARPAAISLEMLELEQVKYGRFGSVELPKNWRYQPPLAYNDGSNLNLAEYVAQNGGFISCFMAELLDASGCSIAYISFNTRDILYYGDELSWPNPARPITQYEAKHIGTTWEENLLQSMRSSDMCPDTNDYVYKQWVNGLIYIIQSHCLIDENNEKLQVYTISLYNGSHSDQILAWYKLNHEKKLEPLLDRILNSIRIDSYPPKIIEGVLSSGHKSITLRLPNYFKEHVSITLPANWSFSEGNPIALPQDDSGATGVKVAEGRGGASQRPRTLAEFLPTGQGKIDMGKADENLYVQLSAEDGSVLGEATLVFADVFTMYEDAISPPQTEEDRNFSASAREKFDRGRAEGLEGCVVSNWQEHGHLPFAKDLLHDSYLKTCEDGLFEVHSVKFRGKGRAPTFVFTGLFPADAAREMRPVMAEIMDSLRPEQ